MALQVERGLVYPAALSNPASTNLPRYVDRLTDLTSFPRAEAMKIVDQHQHTRPVYRPLLLYAWLQAFRLAYETLPRSEFGRWEDSIRPRCESLENALHAISLPNAPLPASRGRDFAEAGWIALALFVAGKIFIRDAWTDLASDTFGRLVRHARPTGALLHAGASDNPETLWYHELLLLHALSSYAVQSEDRAIAAAVAKATDYHLHETQPDHATNQPWALFAFIWNERTQPLADALLHTSRVQQASAPTGLSLILLADALYCLQLFERKT